MRRSFVDKIMRTRGYAVIWRCVEDDSYYVEFFQGCKRLEEKVYFATGLTDAYQQAYKTLGEIQDAQARKVVAQSRVNLVREDGAEKVELERDC